MNVHTSVGGGSIPPPEVLLRFLKAAEHRAEEAERALRYIAEQSDWNESLATIAQEALDRMEGLSVDQPEKGAE